jgi:hypothetical protein
MPWNALRAFLIALGESFGALAWVLFAAYLLLLTRAVAPHGRRRPTVVETRRRSRNN